jgi:hypothetical protein
MVGKQEQKSLLNLNFIGRFDSERQRGQPLTFSYSSLILFDEF